MVGQVSSLKTGVKYKDTPIGKIPVDWEVVRLKDITGVGFDYEKAFATYICLYLDYNSDRLRSMFQGTSTNGLRKGDLELQLISLPPILEQKKIAEILTTVDDAIEKTAQVIEKTKALRKGLIQRLFSRGMGSRELKKTEIGNIPVEWETVEWGQVSNLKNGRGRKEPDRFTKPLSLIDEQMEKESNYREQLNFLKKRLIQVLLIGKLRVPT